MERGLDPLDTNLVVADESRTDKTICLAVSPSLKAYGIPGRPRLFEVVQKVRAINHGRKSRTSYFASELKANPKLAVSYIVAKPRMAYYLDYSAKIYKIYLKYAAPEDIHVYSIDEVFIDVTNYLKASGMTAHEYAMTIIRDVLKTTGITATAGIGTNLYLCKIAMDIMAKKMPADKDGVRIAELDEMAYRRELWDHRPLTDFWRVGTGYAKKLESHSMFTMGDVARCSLDKEDMLYSMFGINAELLIDHAWGWEPCGIADIKSYKPESKSISSGQVLQEPHDFRQTRLIVWEMADLLALDLVDKGLVTDQIVLTIGYDVKSLTDTDYRGDITTDHYGRKVPKHAHGTINLKKHTASSKLITDAALELYDRIMNKNLYARRINITACRVIPETDVGNTYEQMDFFTDYDEIEKEEHRLMKEKRVQKALLDIKKTYGKNSIIKGTNLKEGATAIQRNSQIGGHHE